MRLRITRTIRWVIAFMAYYSGFLRLWCRRTHDSIPLILAYHRVVARRDPEAECSLSAIIVCPDSFREQIAYLMDHYDIVSLERLPLIASEGSQFRKIAVITFDDGWKDNYTNAYPVLREYGIPATIFLVTDHIGTSRWFWPEKVIYILKKAGKLRIRAPQFLREWLGPELDYFPAPTDVNGIHTLIESMKGLSVEKLDCILGYLSKKTGVSLVSLEKTRILLDWDEVKEMASHGISFGSHTQTHPIMPSIQVDMASEEIRGSKKTIEKHLKKPCVTFAYPNGNWDETVRKIVMESGYTCACSVSTTLSASRVDLYSLKRRIIHEGFAAGPGGRFSKCLFAAELAGLFGFIR